MNVYIKNALYLEIYLELNYVTVTVTDFWSSIDPHTNVYLNKATIHTRFEYV